MTGVPRPTGPLDVRLGTNLKAARESAGLRQTDLAEKLGEGWNQGILSQLELGKSSMRVTQLLALARALKIEPVVLLEGTAELVP